METSTFQQIYEHVCRQENLTRQQTKTALLQLAQAFVRGMFTPDLDHLNGAALQRGAYLLDLFLRLYVTEPSQAQRLRLRLKHARSKLKASLPTIQTSFYPDDSPGRDQLAHRWGLSNGIRPASIPGLLDLQRRAYQATTTFW